MARLSDREVETLKLVADGYSPQEIANILFVSYDTIKTRMVKVRRKLSARNTCHAIRIAHVQGYFSDVATFEAAAPHIKALWNLVRNQTHIQDLQSGASRSKNPTGGVK